MDIAICSFFRDSQKWLGHNINQVNKYFNYLQNQKDVDNKRFSYHLVEGNSVDSTYKTLEDYKNKYNVSLIKHDISGSNVASIISEQRFRNLSTIGNLSLNSAKASGAKYILWMESDLIPPHDLLCRLLKWTEDEQWNKTLAIAPIPIFDWDGYYKFYDTWAFEGSNKERWSNDDLVKLTNYTNELRPMNSIGSCALLNGDLLRKYNLDFGTGCFPSLCKDGRNFGLNIYCDTTLKIQHPSSNFVGGRMI